MDPDIRESLGYLRAQSDERGKQVEKLFDLVRDISTKMATKEDVSSHTADCDTSIEEISGRVTSLEGDRNMVRTATKVAIGTPPILAAAIEVGKWLLGR